MTTIQEARMNEKLRNLNGQKRFDGAFKRYIRDNAKDLYFKAIAYARQKAKPRFRKASPKIMQIIKEGKKKQ